jgi:hypothetical protein
MGTSRNFAYNTGSQITGATQVLETSSETVRKSVDLSKTFVKWDGDIPSCVSNLTTKEGPYTYTEIITILSTSEWTDVNMSIQ